MSGKKKTSRGCGRVIILSGPSGAGKTTLHDLLLASRRLRGKIIRSISATTRNPRRGEKRGRDYFFLTQKMFEHKIRSRQLLEWARVFDNYYGTPFKNVRDNLRAGRSVLLCIDVQGARLVKKKIPDALSIFVKTPTLIELGRRLRHRSTDSKDALALRLKTAARELREAGRYDYVIVNGDLRSAARELEKIVVEELSRAHSKC
jgi:guanylate kinase